MKNKNVNELDTEYIELPVGNQLTWDQIFLMEQLAEDTQRYMEILLNDLD